MSLVSFALRTCTVRALRGVTLAGDNVFDSPVDPTDTAATSSTPTIFVYSDHEWTENIDGRALLAGSRTVDLSLLIVLPAAFQATVGGATVAFQDRKAGAAAAIDIIWRQIERALLDEASVWSELWCTFVLKVASIDAHAYVLPVATGQQTRHLPARAVTISLEPIDNPMLGAAPQDAWARLITAMETAEGLAPLAPLLAAAIEGQALPQWRVDALSLGDTISDARDLGYAGSTTDPAQAAPALQQVTVEDTTPGADPATLTITAGQPTSFGV